MYHCVSSGARPANRSPESVEIGKWHSPVMENPIARIQMFCKGGNSLQKIWLNFLHSCIISFCSRNVNSAHVSV